MYSHSTQSDESDTSSLKIPSMTNPFSHKPSIKSNRSSSIDIIDDEFTLSSNSSEERSNKVNDQQLKYRTELCKFYEINGTCKYGDNCIFAHGKENLREKVLNKSGYKKRPCINFFEFGYCMYGNRCQFSHSLSKNDNIKNFSYIKLINAINTSTLNNELYRKIKEKKRLSVFRRLFHIKRENKRALTDTNSYIDDMIKVVQ